MVVSHLKLKILKNKYKTLLLFAFGVPCTEPLVDHAVFQYNFFTANRNKPLQHVSQFDLARFRVRPAYLGVAFISL